MHLWQSNRLAVEHSIIPAPPLAAHSEIHGYLLITFHRSRFKCSNANRELGLSAVLQYRLKLAHRLQSWHERKAEFLRAASGRYRQRSIFIFPAVKRWRIRGHRLPRCKLGEARCLQHHVRRSSFHRGKTGPNEAVQHETPRRFDKKLRSSKCRLDCAAAIRSELLATRLTGFNGSEANYRNILFRDCSAKYAIFHRSAFDHCRFEHCDLSDATFDGATLREVSFSDCELVNVRFLNATLADVDMRGSRLHGIQADPQKLRGVTIDSLQAVAIAELTGVKIQP